jgi:CHAT domain-containing protein/Tfp pilus assembly protein PilF
MFKLLLCPFFFLCTHVALFCQGIEYYQKAKKLFDAPEPTAITDSLSLFYFTKAIDLIKPSPKNAFALFDSFEKTGILKQTYGKTSEARYFYKKAIHIGNHFGLSDSLLYNPLVFCGSIDYGLNSFDSCIFFFERAEKIFNKYPRVKEPERLFNSFGAIYFEAGNYHQSVNYFLKALALHKQREASEIDPLTIYSFESNIGTVLRHLGQYDSAITMYKRLIRYNVNLDQLFTNLGSAYLEKRKPDSALQFLLKAKTINPALSVKWEIAMGRTFLQKGNYLRAYEHFHNALSNLAKKKSTGGIVDFGLTYKLLGDLEKEKKNYEQALTYYQKSILHLDAAFGDSLIERTPTNFTKGFTSFTLFESLAAKAACWQMIYNKGQKPQALVSTINTYRATFKLIDFIGKSFDNENSRLFMVGKAAPLYQEAVDFLISVYEKTGENIHVREAFSWSEKSKAASLAAGIKENEIKSFTGVPDSLLKRERNLKFNLSRLVMKLENQLAKAEEESVQSAIQDVELSLSRLQDVLHEYPAYYQKKFEFDSIDVTHVQKKLLDKHTAILSFFQGASHLHIFVLRQNTIHHHKTPIDAAYKKDIALVKSEWIELSSGKHYDGSRPSQNLYRILINPIKPNLVNCTSLLLIPHNELNGVSFEALENTNGRYLLEEFDVTYQYTLSFLQSNKFDNRSFSKQNILAVAPFYSFQNRKYHYSALPHSEKEVEALPGKKLKGEDATKSNFLAFANNASYIHLATHAVSDAVDPSRSHIVFYPSEKIENKLYAHELYHTPFSKLNLVFLSACESGSGKVVNSEGIMSLSRAFSYAGCANLITSLWKAEDHTTAYISSRFYHYLNKGFSYSKALQQAKIDLIHSPEHAQFHKPMYWANLVLIGNVQPEQKGFGIWFFVFFAIIAIALILFWLSKSKKSPKAVELF